MPQPARYKVFIALGGNIGDVRANLKDAAAKIARLGAGLTVSPLYQTKAEGFEQQPDFLNCVLSLNTALEHNDLLKQLQQIEAALGRVRTFKDAPRTVDIDIICADTKINTPNLTLPHPRAHLREFVLRPLCDIAPEQKLHDGAACVREMLAKLMDSKQKSTCIKTDW